MARGIEWRKLKCNFLFRAKKGFLFSCGKDMQEIKMKNRKIHGNRVWRTNYLGTNYGIVVFRAPGNDCCAPLVVSVGSYRPDRAKPFILDTKGFPIYLDYSDRLLSRGK